MYDEKKLYMINWTLGTNNFIDFSKILIASKLD